MSVATSEQTQEQNMKEGARASEPTEGGPERRARLTEEITQRTGIDEAMIATLVVTFYDRVRQDPLLAPIFAEKVKDWDGHVEKLQAFWSSVALMSGRYHGQPMRAHLPLSIDSSHFGRWLELFAATAEEVCPPIAAAHFIERANRIADSLELGIASQRGELRTPRWERQAGSAATAAQS